MLSPRVPCDLCVICPGHPALHARYRRGCLLFNVPPNRRACSGQCAEPAVRATLINVGLTAAVKTMISTTGVRDTQRRTDGSKTINQKVNIPNVILVSDMIDGIAEIESHMGMGSGAISLDDMLISIGNNVLNIRKTRGLNQGVLANLAGVDRAYISLVENGKQNLTMAALIKLADALNVPVTTLMPASPTGYDI